MISNKSSVVVVKVLLLLNKFIKENPIFKTLPIEEQEDMEKQLEYMRSYSNVLIGRLLRAGVDVLKTN